MNATLEAMIEWAVLQVCYGPRAESVWRRRRLGFKYGCVFQGRTTAGMLDPWVSPEQRR